MRRVASESYRARQLSVESFPVHLEDPHAVTAGPPEEKGQRQVSPGVAADGDREQEHAPEARRQRQRCLEQVAARPKVRPKAGEQDEQVGWQVEQASGDAQLTEDLEDRTLTRSPADAEPVNR